MSDIIKMLKRASAAAKSGVKPADSEIISKMLKEAAVKIKQLEEDLKEANHQIGHAPSVYNYQELLRGERLQNLNLTNEHAALVEAITPSSGTKSAYWGEFKFKEELGVTEDDEPYVQEFTVPWATVKEILAAILDRAKSN